MQLADIFTKGSFTAYQFNELVNMFQIGKRPLEQAPTDSCERETHIKFRNKHKKVKIHKNENLEFEIKGKSAR